MTTKKIFAVLCLACVPAGLALARDSVPGKIAVNARLGPDTLAPGSRAAINITLRIAPSLHLNAHQPLEDFLIPTVVTFDSLPLAAVGPVYYPEPEKMKFSFSETDMAVYAGTVVIKSSLALDASYPLGPAALPVRIRYQACSNTSCFAPVTESLAVPFLVATDSAARAGAAEVGSGDELKARRIIDRGLGYALVVFFLFGLALNLTPCVYPVIPITISFFTRQAQPSGGSRFLLSLWYGAGIAVVFAALGMVSALAGRQWGFLFQNTWFAVVIALIMLILAASMFGAFEITVPSKLLTIAGRSRQGVAGSLVMGLTVGVIIVPCASGIIIGLVTVVAKLGLVVKGTLLFFSMGLGLGAPYIILASFSGSLHRLPKSGLWMVWVKKLFGLVLVGLALYFLVPHFPRVANLQGFLLGLVAVYAGLLLGFLDHAPGYTRVFKIIRGLVGIALLVGGIVWMHRSLLVKKDGVTWVHYTDQDLTLFFNGRTPLFIDFYADWCAPCKKMDRTTFADKEVIKRSRNWTFLKVDCTSPDAAVLGLMERYQVTGMPTLILSDAQGQEKRPLRTTGYVGPLELLQKMDQVRPAQ